MHGILENYAHAALLITKCEQLFAKYAQITCKLCRPFIRLFITLLVH